MKELQQLRDAVDMLHTRIAVDINLANAAREYIKACMEQNPCLDSVQSISIHPVNKAWAEMVKAYRITF